MPYATRMAMFLDRIQTLSRLGDFMVASSQNLLASGIWATIKTTLGMAVGSLSFFKNISELFLRIGRSSSITKELSEVFPSSKELHDLMCEYLIVLVTFCKDIVLVLKKPTLLQLTSSFIAFFDKEASKFETDLGQIALTIDRKVAVLTSQAQVEAASTLGRVGKKLAEWSDKSESKKQRDAVLLSTRVQEMLSPRSDQLRRTATWRRHRKKGTVRWILDDEKFRSWVQLNALWVNNILLVHGKLGSGKTVALANIVAELFHLQAEGSFFSKNIITYFFCNDDHLGSDTPEKIVRSILQQFISQLPDVSYSTTESTNHTRSQLERLHAECATPSLEEQLRLVKTLRPKKSRVFVILDGLDRYDNEMATRVLELILAWANDYVGEGRWLRACISFRTGSALAEIVHKVIEVHYDYDVSSGTSLAITASSQATEMKAFVDAEFERRRHIRTLDKDLEDIIRDVLVGASEGMYLWVALQIEALFPLHGTTLLSDSDVLKLLESPPKDLAEAFKNALNRISDRRYGSKIFQLIASAKRPLTLAELKVALHVKPGETDWSSITASMPQNERAIVGLCGGGLLEVDEEDDSVRFIHHSVSQYLQDVNSRSNPYCFANYEADIHMGFVCTTYLNYSIFDTSITTIDKTAITPDQLTRKVADAISSESSSMKADVTSRLIAAITRRRSPKPGGHQGQEVNIGQLLQRYLKPNLESTELMALADYAQEHWIWHSNRLWIHGKNDHLYRPLKRLLTSTPNHITLPWNSSGEPVLVVDQYPIPPNRPPEPTLPSSFPDSWGLPLPRQNEYRWLRWALSNRHFGVFYEYLTTLPNVGDGPSVRHQSLLQDVFRKVSTEWNKPDFVAVNNEEGRHPRDRPRFLELEPLGLFEAVFTEAIEYIRYKHPHVTDEIIQELQNIVTLDGCELVCLKPEDPRWKRYRAI
ncbi:hypothetical protein QBC37DRAFT_422518 [Rhypophila decipiens]|uniref:NACHT domain-containing protein n=1 Tax=Rhypophila decipiens TaxID=261697 RepID=A0AAN7B889_9PEZI|nr:hypothetical protein QBC37DRAFT_422518 [Rhypophila decipiens]